MIKVINLFKNTIFYLIDMNSKKNILINSRKKFDALRVKKSKDNILLRDEIDNNLFNENQF